MHALDDLRDMLMNELEECGRKGELSTGSLEVIDKLAHAVKCIDTIIAMEERGYSNESGYSFTRGRGSNARRDSMGRYSNRGNSYDGGASYSRRGYSRGDAKEDLVMDLMDIKHNCDDPETTRLIDKFIKQAEE